MTAYLDLADYLLIAEAVTGIDAAVLAKAARIELAESALNAPRAEFDGVEFYPEFVTKAAVLCARLAWNHPLPDGNKRAAWVSLRDTTSTNPNWRRGSRTGSTGTTEPCPSVCW